MPVQRSQNQLRPQAPRADELPAGVPAPPAGPQRDRLGHFLPGNAVSAQGGAARAGLARAAGEAGISALTADPAYQPYLKRAKAFCRAECKRIAEEVGGGKCGPGPSSMVQSASLQWAASQFLFDQAHRALDRDAFAQASKLANDSRQNLLSAEELAARQAERRYTPVDSIAALAEELKK